MYICNYWFRDSWKKLEGTSEMEAKHKYVETLLQAATEVCYNTLIYD